jgi:D-sedoheptulose 7-phosphate isomerase
MSMTREYLDNLTAVLGRLDLDAIDRLSWTLFGAYQSDNTIFCVGNGGSAATASHLATDLTKLTIHPARPRRLRAVSLTESVSTMTAIGNDLAYEEVFAEQLRSLLRPDDVVIGISTSGSSPNVLRAIDYANHHGAITVGITGSEGRLLKGMVRDSLVIRSSSVQTIEDVTMVAGHLLCMLTRDKIADLPVALPTNAVQAGSRADVRS